MKGGRLGVVRVVALPWALLLTHVAISFTCHFPSFRFEYEHVVLSVGDQLGGGQGFLRTTSATLKLECKCATVF